MNTQNRNAECLSGKEDVLLMALDLSASKWQVCSGMRHGTGRRQKSLCVEGIPASFPEEVSRARKKFGLADTCRVVVVYEAGRDGFWPYRLLTSWGYECLVVNPSSLEVPQQYRRRKTDRVDAEQLLRMLQRHVGGEPRVWSTVQVPAEDVEDERRLTREREQVVRDRTREMARARSELATQGVKLKIQPGFSADLDSVRTSLGKPLPRRMREKLERIDERLQVLQSQIEELEQEQLELVTEGETKISQTARKLMDFRALGLQTSLMLAGEFFGWRDFRRTREVGGASGLVSVPFNSGTKEQDQGISKAGPRRVRSCMVELSWRWLRYQPGSALSQWFERRFGGGSKRIRRIGIVALSRKLLIALWKYVERGEVPEGALLN